MKNAFSLFILFLISCSVSAQADPGTQGADAGGFTGLNINSTFGQVLLNKTMDGTYENTRLTYESIKGSPYLNDEAVKGKLVLNDGRVIDDILIQVDLYTENVLVTAKDGEELVLDKKHCWEVILPLDGKDVSLKKLNYKKPNKYYIKLYQDDDLIFFKDSYVTLREGSNQGLAKIDAKFRQRQNYFIKYGEQEIKKVKLKSKDVLSQFSKEEAESLKSYAKSNGFKLKKEKDFVRVFEETRNLVED